MKGRFHAFCLGILLVGLAACGRSKETQPGIATAEDDALLAEQRKQAPTLAFVTDSVRVRSGLQVPDGLDTTEALIRYPVFESGPRWLTDSLAQDMLSLLDTNTGHQAGQPVRNALVQASQRFIIGYEHFLQEMKAQDPDFEAAIAWSLFMRVQPILQRAGVVFVSLNSQQFAGGAHGMGTQLYRRYDLLSARRLRLADMLTSPRRADTLARVAERIFRKSEELSADANLLDAYFFPNGEFRLANEFTLTDKGLLFFYNLYEIKPYAEGTTEVLVPYSQLKGILREEFFGE